MNTHNTQAPLWTLTQQEFRQMVGQIIRSEVAEAFKAQEKEEKTTYIRGNKELAKFLGCGSTKVQKLVASGILNEAMTRSQRTIIYDTTKVLQCIKNNK